MGDSEPSNSERGRRRNRVGTVTSEEMMASSERGRRRNRVGTVTSEEMMASSDWAPPRHLARRFCCSWRGCNHRLSSFLHRNSNTFLPVEIL